VGEADRGVGLGDRNRALVPGLGDGRAQVREVADGTDRVDPAAIEQGEAGGVVSAVLELLEAGDEQIATRPPAHISDDAAHLSLRLEVEEDATG
jgi:hypothetical protein